MRRVCVGKFDSEYRKPFFTVPEQIHRLRERGMECGTDAYATAVLERCGYYRLSGYWHIYRERPERSEDQFDDKGREIRLDSFVEGTSLSQVVALYDFDQELSVRLLRVIRAIEVSFRFFIGHRLGKNNPFAHRYPDQLDALQNSSSMLRHPTKAYEDWMEEYERQENGAKGDFVQHFREEYGRHLPIWVATEVMSFGTMSKLYSLMRETDREILASRLQVSLNDERGDYGAMRSWLRCINHVRNICAHYGRLWNRSFDCAAEPPGRAKRDGNDILSCLNNKDIKNKLYGALLILRYLLLTIAPNRTDVVDIVDFINKESHVLGFGLNQLGFPSDWKTNPIWDRCFSLDPAPRLAASLLDRVECLTAIQVCDLLSSAEVESSENERTVGRLAGAKKKAQKELLRTYRHYRVVIEIKLGKTKYYPDFQFREGKIIDALAEINKELTERCGEVDPVQIAAALLDWWQTPNPSISEAEDGSLRSPLDLLLSVPEKEFEAEIARVDAMSSFVVPRQWERTAPRKKERSMPGVSLIPVKPEEFADFGKRLQKAFSRAAAAELEENADGLGSDGGGLRRDGTRRGSGANRSAGTAAESLDEMGGPIPSDEGLAASFHAPGAETLHIVSEGECVGGLIVSIEEGRRSGSLDFLFLDEARQGGGLGYAAWRAVEARYPTVCTWETAAPYFDKRNIHFCVNKCGFRVVEFFHPGHPDPHSPASSDDGVPDLMFRFHKESEER